jgi:hypothetical protein
LRTGRKRDNRRRDSQHGNNGREHIERSGI